MELTPAKAAAVGGVGAGDGVGRFGGLNVAGEDQLGDDRGVALSDIPGYPARGLASLLL